MELTLLNRDIHDLKLTVQNGDILKLNLANLEYFADFCIEIHVLAGARFEGAFADFSKGSGTGKIDIYLDEEGAEAEFHSAVLSRLDSQKVVDANIIHVAPHTRGLSENYGITEGTSRLTFKGTSHIQNGAYASAARQSAKIIVFDEGCVAKALPILKIDENDVQASHAAIVGKLNEDHMFYLNSRGLSRDEAKRLIILGYLKPIETYFQDEVKTLIDEAIEGGVGHA